MLRTRVTALESYRRVLQEEYAREDELIASIKGKPFEPNQYMLAGTAFHAILADPDKHREGDKDGGYYTSKGWFFDEETTDVAVLHVGKGSCEVPGFKIFQTSHGPITVNGICDRINGKIIRDAKATWSTPDAKNYERSLQWKLYLQLFEADQFAYDIFAFSEPKDGFCKLRDIVSFNLFRYPEIGADCERWVRDFVQWADDRHLLGYLEVK